MKGTAIHYTGAELAWVKACADMPRAEMHALFVQVWNRPEITLTNLASLCKRRGWLTGRNGRFVKGQVTDNGMKGKPAHPNTKATQFKKGGVSHTYRGPGHERIDSKDGYIVMIVAETNPWTGAATRPVHKHRYLWEQLHGAIPKGHRLKCLDGNKANTDPSNWKLIPMGMAPRLNGIRGRGYDAAPPELKPLIMATAELEHTARELRRKKGIRVMAEPKDRDRLAALIEAAKSRPPMTEAELAEQRASWVRGEMGMGSDQDELEYRRKGGAS